MTARRRKFRDGMDFSRTHTIQNTFQLELGVPELLGKKKT